MLFNTPHAITDHCCQLETATEIQATVPKIFHILKIRCSTLMLGSKFSLSDRTFPHQGYPYFHVLVGYPWSNDPDSNVSSSVASGRASDVRQVKGDDPD